MPEINLNLTRNFWFLLFASCQLVGKYVYRYFTCVSSIEKFWVWWKWTDRSFCCLKVISWHNSIQSKWQKWNRAKNFQLINYFTDHTNPWINRIFLEKCNRNNQEHVDHVWHVFLVVSYLSMYIFGCHNIF